MMQEKSNIRKHTLLKNSTEKFNILFEDIQKQKLAIHKKRKRNELFLLEIELINTFYHNVIHDIESVLVIEPDFIIFSQGDEEKKKKEITEIARAHVIETVKGHENIDISRILLTVNLL